MSEHTSEWTITTLAVYHEALREADVRFQEERDRRYAEVRREQEKALQIKEKADQQALLLSSETQKYKDEKANELREQINRERGLYATKDDIAALSARFEVAQKPVVEFIASAGGRSSGADAFRTNFGWIVAIIASLIAIFSFLNRSVPPTQQQPQVILVPAPQGTFPGAIAAANEVV